MLHFLPVLGLLLLYGAGKCIKFQELRLGKTRDRVQHDVSFVTTRHFCSFCPWHDIIEESILKHDGFQKVCVLLVQGSKTQDVGVTPARSCCEPHLFEIWTDVANKHVLRLKICHSLWRISRAKASNTLLVRQNVFRWDIDMTPYVRECWFVRDILANFWEWNRVLSIFRLLNVDAIQILS